MRHPSKESAASARESAEDRAAQALQRRGKLFQAGQFCGEVTCLDLQDWDLYLVPLHPAQGPPLQWDQPASLQIVLASGVLQLLGHLAPPEPIAVNGVLHRACRLRLDPTRVEKLNRRSHFRVAVALKGEIAVCKAGALPQPSRAARNERGESSHLETLARTVAGRRQPCVTHDLSLGGARMSLASPVPRPGRLAFLDLAVAPGEILRALPAVVVAGRAGVFPEPLDGEVRIHFERLSPQQEARLGRLITRVQLEALRRGVRQ